MKYLIAALLLFTAQANAGLISGINLGDGGNVKFVTSIFFNTVEPEGGDNVGTVTQGVGDVQQILDGDGTVLWQDGDNGADLWFTFGNLVTQDFVPVFGQTALFFNTGGTIDFFTHDAHLVLNQDFALDDALVRSGDLWLSGVGDEVGGWTTVATSDSVFNTGSGQFELAELSGPAGERVTAQAILRSDQSLTDFTFNYSSDSLNAGGYEYAGSADIAMVATPVPAPMSASLFALGLAGLMFRRKTA